MNLLTITKRMMSSSSAKRLDLFYDVASPYSWFSFEILHRYKNHWNVDLHLQPVLLGGIFKGAQNTSPLMGSHAKTVHLIVDMERNGRYFEVPIKLMEDIMELTTKGSVSPMRFLTAVKQFCPQHLEEASRKFWMIRWNRDADFTTPAALEEVSATCGMSKEEAKQVLDNLKSNEIKTKLKQETEYAVECGVFGLPSILLHDEGEKKLFFGADRFPLLAQELNEEWKGPNPSGKISKL